MVADGELDAAAAAGAGAHIEADRTVAAGVAARGTRMVKVTLILTEEEARYREEVDQEALLRQMHAVADRWPCCGEPRENGHHEKCLEWRYTAHPDQETLF